MKELLEIFRNSVEMESLDVDGKLLWVKLPTDSDTANNKEAFEELVKTAQMAGARGVVVTPADFELVMLSDKELERAGLVRIDFLADLESL